MKNPRTLFSVIVLMFLTGTPIGLLWAQQPYIIAPNGERVDVERILARPDGSLVVTINGQPRDVTREQYTQAVGQKPEGFDEAVARAQSEGVEAAGPTLEEIMRKSAYQSWDLLAGKVLIEASLAEDNTANASRVFSQLSTRYGDTMTRVFPEMQVTQWKLRIANGDTDGLEAALTTVIREEQNRMKRGMAQIARGDLKSRRRDFSAAVLDYLRAVYFYSEIPELHAEALYKTAEAFAKIGDTGRLRTYQQTLKETYPDSRFATMAIGN